MEPGDNFIFKLYIIVLVLPNIKMNPPHVTAAQAVYAASSESYTAES